MICVIIPTLNEGRTIYSVVRGFFKFADNFPLKVLVVDGHSSDNTVKLVVDGHSSDNTVKLAEEAGSSIIIQKGRGKGAALVEVIDKVKSDVYVLIDGDGTYVPSEFELIINPVLDGKADMVIGSRFKGKAEKGSIQPINIIGNKLFNLVTKLAFKVDISDILSGYRAVRKEVFQKLSLETHHFEIEAEMTLKAIANDFKVWEVPITYLRRRGEPTKLIPLKDGFRIFRTILTEILREKTCFSKKFAA